MGYINRNNGRDGYSSDSSDDNRTKRNVKQGGKSPVVRNQGGKKPLKNVVPISYEPDEIYEDPDALDLSDDKSGGDAEDIYFDPNDVSSSSSESDEAEQNVSSTGARKGRTVRSTSDPLMKELARRHGRETEGQQTGEPVYVNFTEKEKQKIIKKASSPLIWWNQHNLYSVFSRVNLKYPNSDESKIWANANNTFSIWVLNVFSTRA